jgi:hypothetical protein
MNTVHTRVLNCLIICRKSTFNQRLWYIRLNITDFLSKWRPNGPTWLFPHFLFFTVSSPNLEEDESVGALLLPRCYSELPARRNPRDWLSLRSRLILLADSGGGGSADGKHDDLEPVLPVDQKASEPENR